MTNLGMQNAELLLISDVTRQLSKMQLKSSVNNITRLRVWDILPDVRSLVDLLGQSKHEHDPSSQCCHGDGVRNSRSTVNRWMSIAHV